MHSFSLFIAAALCLSASVDAGAVIDVTDATFQELVIKPAHDKVNDREYRTHTYERPSAFRRPVKR